MELRLAKPTSGKRCRIHQTLFKGRIELHEGNNAKAFEERQAETVGVGERVSEVKTFLEEFKDALREQLDENASSVEALGKILEGLGEAISEVLERKFKLQTLTQVRRSVFFFTYKFTIFW